MVTSDRPTLVCNAFPLKVCLFCAFRIVFILFGKCVLFIKRVLEKSFCIGRTKIPIL